MSLSQLSSNVVSLDDMYKATHYFPCDDLTLRKQSSLNQFKNFDLIDENSGLFANEANDVYNEEIMESLNSVGKKRCPEEVLGALVVFDKALDVSFTIRGVEENEFPVIGTFVDDRILPGFRYNVRRCGTQANIFDHPKFLESVGIGYGKRITFKGASKNINENYFWSDTDPSGYAFSIAAIVVGDKFRFVSAGSKESGIATVTHVYIQRELSSHVANNKVVKTIKMSFTCSLKYDAKTMSTRHVSFISNVHFDGIALVVKHRKSRTAVVQCIECTRIGNQKFTLTTL